MNDTETTLLPTFFNYLAFFQIFSLSEDLMKVIPEVRRGH
jgi:hypothetical protein